MSDTTQAREGQEFENERDEGSPEPKPGLAPQVIEAAPEKPLTRGALATLGMDALDRNRVEQVKVTPSAGGVAFATALEVMEFAKLMAVSQKAVPEYLRNNPGMCLAITFQAIEWHMSPFAVANKSYAVNDRIAYESQLLHAIIEARAPLRERLDCRYEGEGPERTCTIIGKFRDGTQREYTTPKFKDIRVKNSPLYKDDPDQQQFYYGSRSWARKWCPDVLLGIYTREEIAAGLSIESAAPSGGDGLHQRLQGADRTEGHRDGHTAQELANVASDATTTIKPAEPAAKQEPAKQAKKSTPKKPAADKKKLEPKAAEPKKAEEPEPKLPAEKAGQETDTPPVKVPTAPKDAAEYQIFAIDWIDRDGDPEAFKARWDNERDLRDECAVPLKTRTALRYRLETKHGI